MSRSVKIVVAAAAVILIVMVILPASVAVNKLIVIYLLLVDRKRQRVTYDRYRRWKSINLPAVESLLISIIRQPIGGFSVYLEMVKLF